MIAIGSNSSLTLSKGNTPSCVRRKGLQGSFNDVTTTGHLICLQVLDPIPALRSASLSIPSNSSTILSSVLAFNWRRICARVSIGICHIEPLWPVAILYGQPHYYHTAYHIY